MQGLTQGTCLGRVQGISLSDLSLYVTFLLPFMHVPMYIAALCFAISVDDCDKQCVPQKAGGQVNTGVKHMCQSLEHIAHQFVVWQCILS